MAMGTGMVARPFIPFINVEIGEADAGVSDANEDVADTDEGFGNVGEPLRTGTIQSELEA